MPLITDGNRQAIQGSGLIYMETVLRKKRRLVQQRCGFIYIHAFPLRLVGVWKVWSHLHPA